FGLANELARAAIHDEDPANLAGLSRGWNGLAVLVNVEQDDVADCVIVPDVVLDLLVVPLECPGVHIEGDYRIAVEVISTALRSVEVRIGITGTEDHEAQLGIDGWRGPYHRPTGLPAIPRVGFRVSRIPTPLLLSGFRIVCRDKPTQRPLTSGATDNHH